MVNYNGIRWKNVRAAVLRRDEYLCQECKRYGKSTEATTVHHILPADECAGEYERFQYNSRNLISLCRKCHERMHIRNSRELSEAGERLLRRKRIIQSINKESI